MTTREAAAYLRISEDYLCRLAGAGAIPATKVGRAWRFAPADLRVTHVPTATAVRRHLPIAAPDTPPTREPRRASSPRRGRGSRGSSARARIAAIDPYAALKQAR